MGVSNLLVKAVDTFPRVRPGRTSRRKRRVERADFIKQHSRPVTVGALLARTQPLPEKSVLLGCCADGLPFLMAMDDPEMGAVLITGNRGSGKTHQLQVMVDAAIRTNRPHELQITVITHNPSEWQAYQKDCRVDKHLQGLFAWYDPSLEGHIQHLTEMVEGRREGKMDGPANLVILDDLNFVETLSPEAQVNLRWLLEYGAQSRVWLVGAVSASQAQRLPFWMEVFRTRIFGWMPSDVEIDQPTRQPKLHPETLEPGTFRAWAGGSWITYQLPLLGDGIKWRV